MGIDFRSILTSVTNAFNPQHQNIPYSGGYTMTPNSVFTMPMSMPMSMPMPMPTLMSGPRFMGVGLPNPNNPQGAQGMQGNSDKANLQSIFVKHNVIDNGDGTYSLAAKDGSGIEKTGTYEELKQYKPVIKDDDASKKKDDPKVTAAQDDFIKNNPKMKLKRDGDKVVDDQGNIYEWKDNKFVKTDEKAGSPRQ